MQKHFCSDITVRKAIQVSGRLNFDSNLVFATNGVGFWTYTSGEMLFTWKCKVGLGIWRLDRIIVMYWQHKTVYATAVRDKYAVFGVFIYTLE